ncbi:tetratricopeptide repeat protein [Suttonella ornithocola]|uniref:Tetratricopeptide repeat protein n=1 Tax=Suttonella ornithocola TaxID=279832 RepID=A0A380MN89_9GAMM|nr:tetratricopeptide repeat protein [Suttonella ornithocola]SUO93762.1 tetratricopeptide repeat protein [Suttonella ornithocola]
MSLSRATYWSIVLGSALYANIGRAQNSPTQQTDKPQWQDSSQWLYGALTSNFAKRADNYQRALRSFDGVAEASKQYNAFSYSYDLAIAAVQLEQATKIAQEWINTYPQDNEAHLALVQALLMQNQAKPAYEAIKIILQNDAGPQNVAQLARLLPYLENGNDRVTLLQQLSDDFPSNPYLYYYLGLAAKEQGQVDLAIEAFNHALRLDKHWRQLELMQAKALSDVGELKEAQKMMTKLRKRYPNDLNLISTEVDMLVDHYQWKKALQLAKRWNQISPGDERIESLIAWLYANNGEYDAAQQAYLALLKNGFIDEDQFQFQMAQAAINAKDNKTALYHLKAIPKDSRMDMLARQQMALMAFDEKNISSAQEQFSALREDYPGYALEMYLVEISRLDNLSEYEAAEKLMQEALNAYPEHVDLLYAQAEHFIAKNDIKHAENCYQKILKVDPANIDALNAYGYLLLTRTERQEEAAKMLREAIKHYPDSPAIQDSYGWLLYRRGKTEEALSWLQRAYAAYRKGEVTAHYIEILAANGKKNLAQEIYDYERLGQPDNPYLQEIGKRLELDKTH